MEFNEFHEWVQRELGLNLKAYKQEQLNRRILSLMSRSKIESLDEYVKVLKTNSEERQKFLDFITINVTEFFRNPELFNEFEVLVKRHLIKGTNRLKIWSAACSIGCEPYSLAIMLKRISPDIRHKILATDIDQTILTRARRGEYTATEIKNIKSEELGLLWNLNKNNYNYSFQKAYCYDSTWDEFGNPTTLYWTLSFQKNNFTNDNSNPKELILYITVEYTDSNQFKISSILKK